MPRRRMMDYMMRGREPRGMRRMDMGMHERHPYEYAMMEDGRRRRNARGQYMSDRAYEHEIPHESKDYGSFHEERGFKPVEAMGYFTGYYGGGSDMRYDGNYAYPRMDYGYDYAGDYGEGLTKDELEEWKMKLMKEVDEKDKHFFTKENISSKARNIGAKMKDYSEEELCLVTLMVYTDYCKTIKKFIGANMDIYVELARDWLEDEDSELKGSERLAVYHDCIIEGED